MKRFLNHKNYFHQIFKLKLQQRQLLPLSSQFSTKAVTEKFLRKDFKTGPGLKEFLVVGKELPVLKKEELIPYLNPKDYSGNGRKVYFEVYGCQMNVNDTEIVWSILNKNQYQKCDKIEDADVILLITCAIREGAETKIWNRLKHLGAMKRNRSIKKKGGPLQIGILGCMAERLKTQLLEKEQWVDVIAGPDSYKDLPRLLAISKNGNQSAVNVLLSLDETYADIMPIRLNENSVTAYVSIMRGCDNMCTYCIVPFTRGKERSRSIKSIENEIKTLVENGIQEVTLLGQNVNSYRDISTIAISTKPSVNKVNNNSSLESSETKLVPGFKTVYKTKLGGIRFAELLECMAQVAPNIRFRFTSPHPKDFPDDVLYTIRKYPNICKNLHLPAQSGSTSVLERMRRGYTREAYINLVHHIRNILPNVSLSSDFICGFCGETDEEFHDTLTLIDEIKYNVAYLFAYSMREKTTAYRRYKDDIPDNIKIQRLQEMIKIFRKNAEILQSKFLGKEELILIENTSKKSENYLFGRNDANIKVIIPKASVPMRKNELENVEIIKPGDFIVVKITESNSQNLKGVPLCHSSLKEFYKDYNCI